jgi:hypothetical protein
MASEEEKDPVILVALAAQHTPTSTYIMALCGLTWETCFSESSRIHGVETKLYC